MRANKFLLSVLISLFSINSFSKDEPIFDFDALNFYSSEGTKSRVDVYIDIPFGKLEFKKSKQEKGYVSEINLTIDVTDKSGKNVFTKTTKEELFSPKADFEYLANTRKIITKNIFLNSGEYKIKLTIYELSTQKTYDREKPVTVKDFTSLPLTLSDVMIVSKMEEVNGMKKITPEPSRNVSTLDTFFLFFFVYNNSMIRETDLECRILNSSNEQVYKTNINKELSFGGDIQNQMIISVSSSSINLGNYTVELKVTSAGQSTSSTSFFTNEIMDFPFSLKEIDKLIDQLQYISKDDELKFIRAGKTDAEKQKRFIEFWLKKDPSPNTKRNEIMIEYYKRIQYANKNYTTMWREGWITDMGMVYIIFGLPGNIDRHPYEMDTKPYEVWDYYDINRQFIFVDNSGFGDYRLVTPIWDEFIYKREP